MTDGRSLLERMQEVARQAKADNAARARPAPPTPAAVRACGEAAASGLFPPIVETTPVDTGKPLADITSLGVAAGFHGAGAFATDPNASPSWGDMNPADPAPVSDWGSMKPAK